MGSIFMALAKFRWLALVVALGVTLGSDRIATQAKADWNYREIKRTLDPKTEKLASDFNRGNNKDTAEGTKAIQECCLTYIARLTARYDQTLPKFESVRRQLDSLLMEGVPKQPPEARQALVTTLVQAAGVVAGNEEYSPAARINCVLILGELDEARDPRQNLRKPSAAARDKLIQIHAAATSPIYLKAVALQGIERHAREPNNGWDDAVKKKVVQAALVYANSKPARDNDQQANAWLTRRSLDILRTMRSKDAVESALGFLGDADELPSLRMSALQYLIAQDVKSFNADQKKAYVLGIAHLLRSRLVSWYYSENDRQKRKSGAMGAGMGSEGPGASGFGFGGGDDGGRDGGFDPGGEFGGPGLGGGRGAGTGGRGSGQKPIDTQAWETRMARRQLNQLTQYVRFALEGKPTESESVKTANFLNARDAGVAEEFNLARMIELINNLQKIINDADRITTVQSLMNQSKRELEAIMRYVKGLPGFLDRYPDLKSGEEELQEVEESSDDDASKPAGDPTGNDDGNAGDNQGGGNQGGGNQGGGQPGN